MSVAEASVVSNASVPNRKVCNESVCPIVKDLPRQPIPSPTASFDNGPAFKSSYRSSFHNGNEQFAKGLAELNEILDNINVLCKNPVCYNEYMGYSMQVGKRDPATSCNKPLCPLTSKYFHKGQRGPRQPTIPCNSEECPYTKQQLDRKGSDCLDCADVDFKCGGATCPYTNSKASVLKHPSLASTDDNCGGLTCPYGQKPPGGMRKQPSIIGADDTCGGLTCPYEMQKSAPAETCGGLTCPYESQKHGLTGMKPESKVGLCGRYSCPYACIKTNNTQGTAYPAITAPPCPNLPQTLTCQDSDAYGACGICCSYTIEGRMPVYSSYDDYGMMKEASRPYSGSTCPYATCNSGSPTNLDQNFYSCLYGNDLYNPISSKPTKPRPKSSISESSGIKTPEGCECTKSDVEPCRSPDCKLTKLTGDCNREVCPVLRVLSFCKDCGGVMVSPGPKKNDKKAARSSITAGDAGSDKLPVENIDVPSVETKDNPQAAGVKNGQKVGDEGEQSNAIAKKPKQKKKHGKKSRSQALYQYPGVELGHRECAEPGLHVPRNMGWLWTSKPQGNIKLWRGYKPGAVPRGVHKMMVKHRRDLGIIDPMDYAIRKKKSKSRTKFEYEEPKHAFILKKINGAYTVILNPLKDPKTLQAFESPFIECTPMQFKIEKEIQERKPKPPPGCPCDQTSSTESIPSSITQSDIEFHFSPPAALPDLRPKKKKNMQDIETQYNVGDVPGMAAADKKGGGKTGKGGKGKKGKK